MTLIKQNDELMRCLAQTQSGLKTRLHEAEGSRKGGECDLAEDSATPVKRSI